MSGERFLPLTEANTERIRTNLTLPYGLDKAIGINARGTETLCQIGGIASISLKNSDHRSPPTIVGITKYGNAIAGFTSTKPVCESTNTTDPRKLSPNASWSHLEISINNNEVRTRLEMQKKDDKDPANWAKILDQSLKDGISSAAFRNLVKRRSGWLGLGVLYNLVPLSFMIRYYSEHDIERVASTVIAWQFVDKFSEFARYGFEKPGEGKRFSLFLYSFPELDRMFLLGAISPFYKLSKDLN